MTGEPSSALPKLTKEVFTGPDSSGLTGFHQTPPHALTQWQHDHQRSSAMGLHDQELPDKQHLPPVPSIPSQFMTPGTQHFLQTPQPYPPLNAAPYPIQQPPQQTAPHLAPLPPETNPSLPTPSSRSHPWNGKKDADRKRRPLLPDEPTRHPHRDPSIHCDTVRDP
ncbi:hypothetical protein QJS10_CPA09g01273 [Acorus calamus]|uniref:Uncharacterized protein n=1 Tax=Acorus calamus TaxID=4465 RepID=A0AAV9E268_ACOCL|nr:hypothetical protein QJS10_CPA09g01273 [Acorus calamus]